MIFPRPLKAGRAIFRLINRLLSRKKVFVDPTTRAKRLSTCFLCPRLDAQSQQCGVCSCFVALKAELTTEDCPEGRWP